MRWWCQFSIKDVVIFLQFITKCILAICLFEIHSFFLFFFCGKIWSILINLKMSLMVTPYLNYFFVLYLVVLYWNLSLYNVCDMKDGFKKKKIYFVVSSLIILTGLPIRFINVQFLLKKKKKYLYKVWFYFLIFQSNTLIF